MVNSHLRPYQTMIEDNPKPLEASGGAGGITYILLPDSTTTFTT